MSQSAGRQFVNIKFQLSCIMKLYQPGHMKDGIVILLCIFESMINVFNNHMISKKLSNDQELVQVPSEP